jgi:hypothetical protein
MLFRDLGIMENLFVPCVAHVNDFLLGDLLSLLLEKLCACLSKFYLINDIYFFRFR